MFQHVPIVLTSPLKLGSISQVEGRLLVDPSHLVGKVAVHDEEGLTEVIAKVSISYINDFSHQACGVDRCVKHMLYMKRRDSLRSSPMKVSVVSIQ